MEGINHSCRERLSWSDRGVRNGIKTFCLPFGSQGTLLLANQHTLQHVSFASLSLSSLFPSFFLSISIYLSISFLSHPSFTTLCTHRQHSIIRPRQLQPLRLTTEEFDRAGEPLRSSRAGRQRVRRFDERSAGIDRRKGRTLTKRSSARRWRRLWQNNLVRAFFVFHQALICFPVICCSVPLPFLGRVKRRANICLSQSPGIIWNKHLRHVINLFDVFPTTQISRGRGFAKWLGFEMYRHGIPVTEFILYAELTVTELSRWQC